MTEGVNGRCQGMPDALLAFPPVAPPAPAPERSSSELGEVLSPSQTKTVLECPGKWYFKYLVGLPEPSTGSLALGTAVHAAIGANFRQKITTHEDLPQGAVAEAFSTAWAEAVAEAELRDDENPDELHELGRELTIKYLFEAAPRIQPAHVELPVAGKIGGVEVRGFIDLVEQDGTVVDLKTAGKRPGQIPADYRLQLTTYDLLCPHSRGKARLDTLVKTKTIQLVQQSTEIGPADVQYAETIYPMVQDAIKDGIFYPRRTSRLCSRRNCAFWRACEKEFGGEVAE